jgi:major membrane immunogen (membrane-anchored lipoprotein)
MNDPSGLIRRQRIRELNDAFRASPIGGKIMLTQGVRALSDGDRATALVQVGTFSAFTPDNDPHGEHDFGAIEIGDEKLFWKIDYFDPSYEFGSDDAADPNVTRRVLTIMLAEEY